MYPSVEDDVMNLQNSNNLSPDSVKEELKVEEETKKPATRQAEEAKNDKYDNGSKS
jgi:hypothetical protein